MGLFHLTIAEDELEKQAQGFQNLRSLLYGFIAALAVALTSGFCYQLLPRQLNWNAAQTLLVLHLVAGVMALFLLLVFLHLHLRQQQQSWRQILWFWALRRRSDEEPEHFAQRLIGFTLTWVLLAALVSGMVLSLPGLLYYFGFRWMQGYALSQSLLLLHWLAALLVPLPLLLHLLWKSGRGA